MSATNNKFSIPFNQAKRIMASQEHLGKWTGLLMFSER